MNVLSSTEITSLPIKWLRVPGAVRYSGFSRSLLYQLIAEGKIRSVCIRKRGSLRGVRIISAESIDTFLENSTEEASVQ
jgi:hypothetical protein